MRILLTSCLIVLSIFACSPKDSNDNSNSANQETKVLVKVKKISPEKFEHFFLANGSVEAVNDAFISPEVNGQIKKIHVKEGQRVSAGQLLISLNSDVIKSGITEVETSLKLANTIYKKREGLWKKKIGSEVQYLESKTNKESLENKLKTLRAQLMLTQIKAPIKGIVDEIISKEGELAIPGLQLIRLVNLQRVYVNADVSEAYLPKIKIGDPVQVSFPSYPDYTVDTVIHRIGNVVKAENRTFLVQLLLDNPDERLKPNVLGIIKIKDYSLDEAFIVPSIIIKNDLNGSYVYVVKKEGSRQIAAKTYIDVGMSEKSQTVISNGLKLGQDVIIEGYNLVKNGMEIKVTK
jgi:RND family efflux transporter MFP subunit